MISSIIAFSLPLVLAGAESAVQRDYSLELKTVQLAPQTGVLLVGDPQEEETHVIYVPPPEDGVKPEELRWLTLSTIKLSDAAAAFSTLIGEEIAVDTRAAPIRVTIDTVFPVHFAKRLLGDILAYFNCTLESANNKNKIELEEEPSEIVQTEPDSGIIDIVSEGISLDVEFLAEVEGKHLRLTFTPGGTVTIINGEWTDSTSDQVETFSVLGRVDSWTAAAIPGQEGPKLLLLRLLAAD